MSADRSGITIDAWMAELSKLGRKSAEGFTSEEAASQAGRSVTWARTQMKKAFRAGLLEMAGTRESARMDGRPCWVPVYRVTPPFKKGAKKP